MASIYEDYLLNRPRTFRVLLPEKRTRQGSLSYRLGVRNLEDPGSFAAVSYVWGEPILSECLLVNGKQLLVTKNLLDALESIENHHDKEKHPQSLRLPIWADQLCINQKNNEERSLQVELMADIYSNAERVYIRLGKSSVAHDVVHIINYLIPKIRHDMEKYGVYDDIPRLSRDEIEEYNKLNWTAMREMTSSVWFQRMWVIQEVGLAKNPIVLFGDCYFDWKLFMLLLDWLSFPASRLYQFNKLSGWTAHQLWQSFDVGNRNKTSSHKLLNFLDILSTASQRYKATDPRDYIYALLGHPLLKARGAASSALVRPDYTLPEGEIFLQFATAWLEADPEPYILSCVNHRWLPPPRGVLSVQPSDVNALEIPTWCPRWDYIPLGGTRIMIESRCGYWDASSSRKFWFRREGGILEIECLPFDTVSNTFLTIDEIELSHIDQQHRYHCSNIFNIRELDFITKLGILCSNVLEKSVAQQSSTLTAFASTVRAGLWKLCDAPRFEALHLAMLKNIAVETYRCKRRHQKDGHIDLTSNTAFDRFASLCESLDCDAAWEESDLVEFVRSTETMMESRRLFVSDKGYIGLAPDIVSPADICCIVAGACVPLIMRPCMERQNSYFLVGECYVHGVMHGQATEVNDTLTKRWTKLCIE